MQWIARERGRERDRNNNNGQTANRHIETAWNATKYEIRVNGGLSEIILVGLCKDNSIFRPILMLVSFVREIIFQFSRFLCRCECVL